MRLERILDMGPSEIAYRTWQAAAKQLDRVAVAGAVRARLRDAAQASPQQLLQFQRGCRERFFAGAFAEGIAQRIAERTPRERDAIVASADRACRHRFDLLGYGALDFGEPVDWSLDAVSGVRAPHLHWSRIDPLDFAQVGDSKVTWELNRHQWMVDLGQAYRHTLDERYAARFAQDLCHWMESNPPGIGINWASSLEVAYRLIAWSWALALFRGAAALTPELFARARAWIAQHAAHVERYLSYYFSPNTHLTGEALGLFYAGVVFADLPGAARWRELGQRILLAELDRQVLADGVHFEQSTHYQRYVAEIYLHFLVLAARNGIEVPASARQRVQRVLDVLLALRRQDGSVPAIGDADGGSVLPLVRRSPLDTRGVFAVAAALFGRSDYAAAAQPGAPEVLWLLGADAARVLETVQPEAPAAAASGLLPDGGYGVMREAGRAHRLIFDVGPLGCTVSGAHGHADLLAIQCEAFGKPFLVDPGTYCYTADPAWREHFRNSAAHNTVTVDGLSQARTAGPFSWQARPSARLRRWVSTATYDLADAEHDAYGPRGDPVRHRRRVYFRKPHYWLVVDDVQGRGVHRVALRYQFGPMPVTAGAGPWVRAGADDQLLVQACSATPLARDLVEGGRDPIAGWVSADYGQRAPAPLLTYSAEASLPLRVVTVLLPVRGPAMEGPPLESGQAAGRFYLFLNGLRDTAWIDDDDIVVHGT